MVGVELLYDMIRTKNKEVLDRYEVTLDESNLRFTELYPGDFSDDTNTTVLGTAFGSKITGSEVYFYKRHHLQEAFAEIGVDVVTVELNEPATFSSIMYALRKKYNLALDYQEVKTFTLVDNVATITPIDQSYVWVGELSVTVVDGELSLGQQFPYNVLNGLTGPYEEPLTDGGNYDQLVGASS